MAFLFVTLSHLDRWDFEPVGRINCDNIIWNIFACISSFIDVNSWISENQIRQICIVGFYYHLLTDF